MIKLTKADYRAGLPVGVGVVWIAPSHIQAIDGDGVVTYVRVSSYSYSVMERPEQIMAMPEMVWLTYPMMALNGPGKGPLLAR